MQRLPDDDSGYPKYRLSADEYREARRLFPNFNWGSAIAAYVRRQLERDALWFWAV
jgi:hypothetical protein